MKRLRSLGLLHLIGNEAALWLGYYWLGIGESKMMLLAWSFVVGLVTIALFGWLHGTGFAFFRDDKADVARAMRFARVNLPPLVLAALVVLILYGVVGWLQDWSAGPAFKFASFLTLKLRKPVKPASMIQAFGLVWWIVRWVVLPVLILPMISAISTKGWRGFGSMGPIRHYKLTWLETPLLLLCAVKVPFNLLAWHPVTSGFGPEMFSLLVRLLVAYLFFTVGCLALEFSASRQSPRVGGVG